MSSSDNGSWYAVRVKSRHEKVVGNLLAEHVGASYVPLYQARHRWADRYKEVSLPLFPGYVFGRFEALKKAPVLSCPGVLGIVSVGRTPIAVDEVEIQELRRLTGTRGLTYAPSPFIKTGEGVELCGGPLRGLRGILVRIKNDLRLVISVSLLQRSVVLEIDRTWVRAASRFPPGEEEMPTSEIRRA